MDEVLTASYIKFLSSFLKRSLTKKLVGLKPNFHSIKEQQQNHVGSSHVVFLLLSFLQSQRHLWPAPLHFYFATEILRGM